MPENKTQTTAILAAAGAVPVTWAALKVAPFMSEGLSGIVRGLTFDETGITWCENSPEAVMIFLLAYALGVGIYCSTRRNYRRGEEHGSAKWGSARRICRKYAAKDPAGNIIVTQNFRMGLDCRAHHKNVNILIVGDPGSGKSRFYAKPNIMQGNCSYVILDPKGELLRSTGNFLQSQGYSIKVIDLLDMEKATAMILSPISAMKRTS